MDATPHTFSVPHLQEIFNFLVALFFAYHQAKIQAAKAAAAKVETKVEKVDTKVDEKAAALTTTVEANKNARDREIDSLRERIAVMEKEKTTIVEKAMEKETALAGIYTQEKKINAALYLDLKSLTERVAILEQDKRTLQAEADQKISASGEVIRALQERITTLESDKAELLERVKALETQLVESNNKMAEMVQLMSQRENK